jgi:hypothetical protein
MNFGSLHTRLFSVTLRYQFTTKAPATEDNFVALGHDADSNYDAPFRMAMVERHQTCGTNALLDAKFDNRVAEPMTGERSFLYKIEWRSR